MQEALAAGILTPADLAGGSSCQPCAAQQQQQELDQQQEAMQLEDCWRGEGAGAGTGGAQRTLSCTSADSARQGSEASGLAEALFDVVLGSPQSVLLPRGLAGAAQRGGSKAAAGLVTGPVWVPV